MLLGEHLEDHARLQGRAGGVLILSGAFGTGHLSAAEALSAQLAMEGDFPSVRVDLLKWLAPKLSGLVYGAFRRMVEERPGLFNLGYRQTGEGRRHMRLLLENPVVRRLALSGFDRLLEQWNPCLVVAVVPFAGQLFDLYRRETGCQLPLCVCMTDSIVHAGWLTGRADRYLVATEEVRSGLLRRGIAEDRIAVTGVPVRPAFLDQAQVHAPDHPDKPLQLLMMGGGWGLMTHDSAFYSALERMEDLEVTVLAGSNAALLERLRREHPGFRSLGYTDRVHEHMARAHLLLTKAGGLTMFEAIYSGLPLMVEPPFLEQERYNAQVIQRMDIGVVLRKGENPAVVLRHLLEGNRLSGFRHHMDALRQTLDGYAPAKEILSMVPVGVSRQG